MAKIQVAVSEEAQDSGELAALVQGGTAIAQVVMEQIGKNMETQANAQVEIAKQQQIALAQQEETKRHAETEKHATFRTALWPTILAALVVVVGCGVLLWQKTITPEHIASGAKYLVAGAAGWFASDARKKSKGANT
ncbi:MAG: hypothetical protein EXR77_17380 [Myxococcales bacterium]|nr:hypothetical protein [Myxococcales bacterium]